MGLSRWLSIPQWCIKVLYGAAMVTLITISLFGRGYHISRSVNERIQNIDSKQQEKSSGGSYVQKYIFENENNNLKDKEYVNVIVDSTEEKDLPEDVSNDFETATENIYNKMQIKESLAPNIPREIFSIDRNDIQYKRGVTFPSLSDIIISNKYWQYFKISTGVDLYLFNAFYDHRKMFENKAFVRVLAMAGNIDEDIDIYCKFWFKNMKRKPISAISRKEYIKYRNDSALNTCVISCKVPLAKINEIPFAVSLVEHRRDKATNYLQLINIELESDTKQDFAVCHKGLDFPFYDNSIKLVEWIELLSIMGVSKIVFYKYNIHPNISKVLQYYTKERLVEVSPLTLPGDQPNTPKELNEYLQAHYITQLSHEKIPYNDCYFRNMNKYKYILNIDIDEMLIPKRTHTWKELMDIIGANLTNTGEILPSQYHFERFTSLESMQYPHGYATNIPKHMYMLQNIYRSNEHIGVPKTFFNTDLVISSTNHISTSCKAKCTHYRVPNDVATIMHYRKSCKIKNGERKEKNACNAKNSVKDTAIWKYKDELISRTTKVLKKLELI